MDPATRGLLEATKARLDIIDARLELMGRRLDLLETVTDPQGQIARLPKFKLKDINARLEGDDVG